MRRAFEPALANLGFLLQVNGLLLFIPLTLAIFFGEPDAAISFAFALLISLVSGLLLTNYFRRTGMTFESVALLLPLTYILLAAVGSVPYIFLGGEIFPGQDMGSIFVDSYFESLSGFSTTGLSLIPDIETLPKSLILFRGLTQWLGGLSIVFLMILFVSEPGETSRVLGDISGFERLRTSVRGTFVEVLKIYLFYSVIFVGLTWMLGGINFFDAVNLVFTGISTSGFSPVNDLEPLLNPVSSSILMIMMITGATSFSVHRKIFERKTKGSLVEFQVYLTFLLVLGGFVFMILTSVGRGDIAVVIFHTISASTTTGFQFAEIHLWTDSVKILLMALMFVGGMSFSTAGGVKMIRLIVAVKAVAWTLRRASLPNEAVTPLRLRGRTIIDRDLILVFVLLFLGFLSIFVSTFIFSLFGYSFADSAFELTSAFSLAGLSVGVTSWLFLPS